MAALKISQLVLMMVMTSESTRLINPPEDYFTTDDCGGYFSQSNNGTISSPNYPNAYPAYSYCYYTIYLGGPYFYVSVTDLDLASGDTLTINVNDGWGHRDASNYLYNPRYSNYATIIFRGTSANAGRGFQIHWNKDSPVYNSPWRPDPDMAAAICAIETSELKLYYQNYYKTVPVTNVTALASQDGNGQDSDEVKIPDWWYTEASNESEVNVTDSVTQDPYYYMYTTQAPNPNCGGLFDTRAGEFVHDFSSDHFSDLTNEICEYSIYSDVKLRLIVEHVGTEDDGVIRVDTYMTYPAYTGYSFSSWNPVGYLRGNGSFESCGYGFKVLILNPRQQTNGSYVIRWFPEELDGIKVRCDENFYQVEINRTILEEIYPNANITDLRLNDEDASCWAKIFGDVVVFQSSLTGCGMIRTDSLSHYVYENVIASDASVDYIVTTPSYYGYNYTYYSGSAQITRNSETGLGLEVHCRVTRYQETMSKYIPLKKVNNIATGHGDFTLDMDFYWDISYTSRIDNYPLFIDLNKQLYVQVSLKSVDPDLHIVLSQCTAVNAAYIYGMTYDSRFYPLISSGCTMDTTVQIHSSNVTEERFSFRTFRFINTTVSDVYLVCYVHLCNNTDTLNCQPGCHPKRYRRDAEESNVADGSYRILRGPIRIPPELGLTAGCQMTGVTSPALVMMLATIVLVFWRI